MTSEKNEFRYRTLMDREQERMCQMEEEYAEAVQYFNQLWEKEKLDSYFDSHEEFIMPLKPIYAEDPDFNELIELDESYVIDVIMGRIDVAMGRKEKSLWYHPLWYHPKDRALPSYEAFVRFMETTGYKWGIFLTDVRMKQPVSLIDKLLYEIDCIMGTDFSRRVLNKVSSLDIVLSIQS